MKIKDFFHVNTRLLPFKLHFFFVCGGFAGVTPFMPVIAKQLGINATAVGIGYSMVPVFIFISNPFIGFLVDFFQNIKAFLAFLLVACTASYFSVLSIPVISHELSDAAYVRVSHRNGSEALLNISVPFERTCLEALLEEPIDCKLRFKNELSQYNNSGEGKLTDSIKPTNFTYEELQYERTNESADDKFWVTFYTDDVSLPDMKDKMTSLKVFHCSPSFAHCALDEKASSVFSSYQFWAFITIAVLGAITSASIMTLSSVGSCEVLGADIEAYGRQRLFGTISYGLVCTLAGILNDIPNSSDNSFLPGFYLMAIFMTIDIIIICKMHIPKANISTSMCKDLGKIFSSKEILIFSIGVVFVGIFNSIIAVYEFWFLEDMGASRTQLGLAVFMQCLVGEVPFLFFSGWFVRKLGHFLCFVGVFVGFTVRLLSYSLIKDPWLVLPVDIMHGLTFGLYHGAMTSFAKERAPKGMEATLLGILGGLYDGLGYGLGSFLGGIGLDNLGSRKTFFSMSMLSLTCLLAFMGVSYLYRASARKKAVQVVPTLTEETLNGVNSDAEI